MSENRDVELGEIGDVEAEQSIDAALQEIWDSYRTGHKRGIPGLALDLALDKTLGGQVFLHLPGIYLGILYRTKRAASLQLKALQGLQNKPDPSFGEEENVDMEKLCDINSKIMEDYALLSHLNGQRVPSKYDISRVERLTQFYSDDSDYKTPFQGRRDLHRALNKGDFVLDVVKWMFNHRVRHLLYWLKKTEVDAGDLTRTSSGLQKTRFIAAIVLWVAFMTSCFLPICLMRFGYDKTPVFTLISLVICTIVVTIIIFGGDVRPSVVLCILCYLTLITPGILDKQLSAPRDVGHPPT